MKNTVLLIIVAFIITAQPVPAMADYGRFNGGDLGHPLGWIFGAALVFFAVKEWRDNEKRRNEELNEFLNQKRGENHDQ